MSGLKKIFDKLSKELKFSASDPSTFNEVWSFQSTGWRLISLVLILLICLTVLTTYLFVAGPLSGYFSNNDVPIERTKLEEQNKRIAELNEKVKQQENYLSNITKILQGESPEMVVTDTLTDMPELDYNSLNDKMTDAERQLLEEINDDIRSVKNTDEKVIVFGSPVVGEISQHFDRKNHPGIDIVTKLDSEVKACQSGVVLYAGYTRKDGYLLLIDHGNGFLSVYKHNKTLFKKMGDRVQLGDPLAIVGNSGENTSGPHLHFELWHNQKPVNPTEYITFKN